MKCWYAPSKKRTKTRSSGVSKPSNVKRLRFPSPARGLSYFAASFITVLNLSIGKTTASTDTLQFQRHALRRRPQRQHAGVTQLLEL